MLFVAVISKFEIPRKCHQWSPENGELITFHGAILIFKKYRIGILSPRDVIEIEHPVTVGQFFSFQVTFDVDRKVHSEIIRNPVSISLGVIDMLDLIHIVYGNGKCYRAARGIYHVQRKAESPGHLYKT